jgi:hypothetical protein
MKKLRIFLCLLAIIVMCPTAFAQNERETYNVDFKKIEDFVKKQHDQFESQMQRFIAGDTTLTLEEIANVFYGSDLSTDYSHEDAPEAMLKAIKNEDFDQAFELGRAKLEKSPASLDLLLKMMYCCDKLGRDENALNYQTRAFQLIDIILASGDGRTCETAFKVVNISDEYTIIFGVFDMEFKQQALMWPCDEMTLYANDPDDEVVLYFDVTLHMNKLNDIFGSSKSSADKKSKGKKGGKKSR